MSLKIFNHIAFLLLGFLIVQGCNTCNCKSKQNKPHFNADESQLIPEHSGPSTLFFQNQTGDTDTLYYDTNAFYVKSECGSPVIFVPTCCVCPADHILYHTSSFMDHKTNYLNSGFFRIHLEKDQSDFRASIYFNGDHLTLEDAIRLDTVRINNRSFSNVLRWRSTYDASENRYNFSTVYYSEKQGILKAVKPDSSVWVKQF